MEKELYILTIVSATIGFLLGRSTVGKSKNKSMDNIDGYLVKTIDGVSNNSKLK